jgi:diguanylate cyclase (GGDEF)-like protein
MAPQVTVPRADIESVRADVKLAQAARNLLPGSPERGGDPYADLNLEDAESMGALMWLAGLAIAAILLPFNPPTVPIGWGGWLLAAAALAISAGIVWRRLGSRFSPSVNEIFAAGYLGVGLIALLEWLGGGHASQYHYLYALPAVFAGAIHSPRRLMAFATVLALAVFAPLAYDSFSAATALDSAGLLLLLFALALASRTLVGRMRGQRASLQSERDAASRLARVDPLTGLGNRLAFEEALEGAVARAQRSGRPLSLLMADLDSFKQINDELGHIAGDRCLCTVAAALKESARAGDDCFRWGGDEFVVILADSPASEAEPAAQRLAFAVTESCEAAGGRPLSLTCAIAELGKTDGVAELVAAVDCELLHSKRSRVPR